MHFERRQEDTRFENPTEGTNQRAPSEKHALTMAGEMVSYAGITGIGLSDD
jgi:hypothetical protein